MNKATSMVIAVVAIISIIAFLYMLVATGKRNPNETETTGHVWDGNLSEYNKPMPRWWLNLFWLTAIWGFGYFVAYPGLGAFKGSLNWSSAAEHDAQKAAIDQKFEAAFGKLAEQPFDALAKNADAMKVGKSVFANNCVTCHGAEAKGARGFPNLTDHDWLWGGEPDTIFQSVMNGRTGAMPALGPVLTPEGVREVAVYVQSLSGNPADATLAARGKTRFDTVCIACHGIDGKGNPLLGAPNLTDNIWLYGGDYDTLIQTIEQGRNGQMPAHAEILGATRARLVAAWVHAQSKVNATTETATVASH